MKIKILLFFITCSFMTFAQNGINYKALIKDDLGNVVVNQSITIQFTILEDVTSVYEETHTSITDDNGIAIINIGEGTPVSGDFSTIDWGSDEHFLNVQIDIGSGLVDMGTTAFKAVPYAINSKTSESVTYIYDVGSFIQSTSRNQPLDLGISIPITKTGTYYYAFSASYSGLEGGINTQPYDIGIEFKLYRNIGAQKFSVLDETGTPYIELSGSSFYERWARFTKASNFEVDLLFEGDTITLEGEVLSLSSPLPTGQFTISQVKVVVIKLSD